RTVCSPTSISTNGDGGTKARYCLAAALSGRREGTLICWQDQLMAERIEKTDEEWRQQLPPERYHILREHGTEPAWTGALLHNKETGIYRCAACGNELYRSDTKFESGSGWPSFYQPIRPDAVQFIDDKSYGMRRTEVRCGRCGSHLGHVFPDAPQTPTG